MARCSVLIVEDEQIVAMDLSITLSRLGYSVAGIAFTAADAIRMALQHRPHVILMDVRLKGERDGIEAATTIRSAIDVPLIYLTAYADDQTLARARDTAPYGYLVKPFDERSLRTTIEIAIERAAISRALRESEERLAQTLASITDGVIATDAEGRVVLANPTAEALLELTHGQALGHSIEELVQLTEPPNGGHSLHPARLALQSRRQATISSDSLLRTHLGAVWVEGSAAPIFNIAGQPTGVVLVLRDTSARRRAEEDRRVRLHQEAELRYHERLQLLAGGIAHDLGNILTVVLGNLDLLRIDLNNSDQARHAIDQSARAVQRAVDLTKQLIAYARRTHLLPRPVALAALVTETIELLQPMINERIAINISISAELPPPVVDPIQLQQVLMNLLLNAAEAIGDGPGQITIAASEHPLDMHALSPGAESDNWSAVALSVIDDGCGMDTATMERIFDPYFSTKHLGRGLGLATARGIVEEHSGTLTVTSAPGSGTTFTLVLPAQHLEPLLGELEQGR